MCRPTDTFCFPVTRASAVLMYWTIHLCALNCIALQSFCVNFNTCIVVTFIMWVYCSVPGLLTYVRHTYEQCEYTVNKLCCYMQLIYISGFIFVAWQSAGQLSRRGDTKTLQRGSRLAGRPACALLQRAARPIAWFSAAGPGPADMWERSRHHLQRIHSFSHLETAESLVDCHSSVVILSLIHI